MCDTRFFVSPVPQLYPSPSQIVCRTFGSRHIVYMNHAVTQTIYLKILESNEFCVIANKLHLIFSISTLPGHENVTVLITWLTRGCDFSQSRNTIVRYRMRWKVPFLTHMIWLISPKMIALQFWQREFQIIELRISKNENGTGKCRTYDYHFEYSNGNIITIASVQHRWRFQIIEFPRWYLQLSFCNCNPFWISVKNLNSQLPFRFKLEITQDLSDVRLV